MSAPVPAKKPPARKRVVNVPTATPAPIPAPVAPVMPVRKAYLRVWVPGLPVGINHAYGQRGHQKYKTESATEWQTVVQSVVALIARTEGLYGAQAWGVDASKKGQARLALTLNFVLPRAKNAARPDADAPLKLTQDAVAKGLDMDDRVVKSVTSSLTLTDTARTGCLITVERLSIEDCERLDYETLDAARFDILARR